MEADRLKTHIYHVAGVLALLIGGAGAFAKSDLVPTVLTDPLLSYPLIGVGILLV